MYVAIAGLLVAGGALKAVRPVETANALSGVGLPAPSWLVRAGGGAEVVIGAFAVAAGGRVAAILVGGSYLVFAAFVAAALLRNAPISSCGCFGRADTPPSFAHLVVNLLAASVAFVVASGTAPGLPRIMGSQPVLGIPMLLLSLVTAYLVFQMLALLPQLSAVRAQRPRGVVGRS